MSVIDTTMNSMASSVNLALTAPSQQYTTNSLNSSTATMPPSLASDLTKLQADLNQKSSDNNGWSLPEIVTAVLGGSIAIMTGIFFATKSSRKEYKPHIPNSSHSVSSSHSTEPVSTTQTQSNQQNPAPPVNSSHSTGSTPTTPTQTNQNTAPQVNSSHSTGSAPTTPPQTKPSSSVPKAVSSPPQSKPPEPFPQKFDFAKAYTHAFDFFYKFQIADSGLLAKTFDLDGKTLTIQQAIDWFKAERALVLGATDQSTQNTVKKTRQHLGISSQQSADIASEQLAQKTLNKTMTATVKAIIRHLPHKKALFESIGNAYKELHQLERQMKDWDHIAFEEVFQSRNNDRWSSLNQYLHELHQIVVADNDEAILEALNNKSFPSYIFEPKAASEIKFADEDKQKILKEFHNYSKKWRWSFSAFPEETRNDYNSLLSILSHILVHNDKRSIITEKLFSDDLWSSNIQELLKNELSLMKDPNYTIEKAHEVRKKYKIQSSNDFLCLLFKTIRKLGSHGSSSSNWNLNSNFVEQIKELSKAIKEYKTAYANQTKSPKSEKFFHESSNPDYFKYESLETIVDQLFNSEDNYDNKSWVIKSFFKKHLNALVSIVDGLPKEGGEKSLQTQIAEITKATTELKNKLSN